MLAVHIQIVPFNIVKLFTKTSHIHTYKTQSSKSLLFSTKYSELTFSCAGVKIWNKMLNEFKTSKNLFKKANENVFI